jgi:hypothetical protein
MKLNEIIDTEIRSSKFDGEFTDKGYGWRQHPDEDADRSMGKGSYYGAFSKEDNPHEIDKLTLDARKEGYSDGQAEYVMELVDRKISGNNIFAPRVYDFNKIKDDKDYIHISFTEETLLNAADVDMDEIKVIMDQIFSPTDIDVVYSSADDYSFEVDTNQERVTGGIGRTFELMIKKNNINTLSDDLNEVLELVRELTYADGGKFGLDLHDENIMYRRTSTGVQLVISDPIS